MSWQKHAKVTVEIASITGDMGLEAAFWQPDAHGSLWQPAAPDPASVGYAEWVEDLQTDAKANWETLPWFSVHCDQQSISCSTGFEPYGWNAEPGTLQANLIDPKVIYFPLGPIGELDDIGIDTPIRVKVEELATHKTRILWAGLIRQIVHRHSVDGAHLTTITGSEVTQIYGRTNPAALTTPAPQNTYTGRAKDIHDRSDMPNLFPYPTIHPILDPDGSIHPADDLHENVWQEMAHMHNVHGMITIESKYPVRLAASYITNLGTPRVMGSPPYSYAPDVRELQIIQVRPYCSDPMNGAPTITAPLAISPTAFDLTHSLDGLANDIDLAVVGAEGSGRHFTDQTSIDQWGRHTYTRHDLKLIDVGGSGGALQTLGDRMLTRAKDSVYSLETLEFPCRSPRDLRALVGFPVYTLNTGTQMYWRQTGALCAPGESWCIVWESPAFTAYLNIGTVTHEIAPEVWNVRVAGELRNINATVNVIAPIPATQRQEVSV